MNNYLCQPPKLLFLIKQQINFKFLFLEETSELNLKMEKKCSSQTVLSDIPTEKKDTWVNK